MAKQGRGNNRQAGGTDKIQQVAKEKVKSRKGEYGKREGKRRIQKGEREGILRARETEQRRKNEEGSASKTEEGRRRESARGMNENNREREDRTELRNVSKDIWLQQR